MASGHLPVSEWLQRISAEYQEMPGLSLNKVQVQRGRWSTRCWHLPSDIA